MDTLWVRAVVQLHSLHALWTAFHTFVKAMHYIDIKAQADLQFMYFVHFSQWKLLQFASSKYLTGFLIFLFEWFRMKHQTRNSADRVDGRASQLSGPSL